MRTALPQSRAAGRRSAGDRPGRSRICTRAGRAPLAAALALLASLTMLVSFVAAAGADTGTTIINRCTHGQSIGGFSQKAYSRALAELPTEVEEYSDCGNLIRRAQLAAAGGHGGSGGGGGGPAATATPLSQAERASLASVPHTGAAPQRLGSGTVVPGVVHANVASAFSSIPDPLLAILAFMLACAGALGGRAIRNGVRAYRSR
jgi:hypothetical protein